MTCRCGQTLAAGDVELLEAALKEIEAMEGAMEHMASDWMIEHGESFRPYRTASPHVLGRIRMRIHELERAAIEALPEGT